MDLGAELAGWLPQAVGVTAILGFLILGFAKGFIWTRSQVEELRTAFRAHIMTIETGANGRVADALQREASALEREKSWQKVAETTLDTNEVLTKQIEALLGTQKVLQQMATGSREPHSPPHGRRPR